jgi:hypothetical protein
MFTYKIQVPKKKYVASNTFYCLPAWRRIVASLGYTEWNGIRLCCCETTVNILHRKAWGTDLICNYRFVRRNYKAYCTALSTRNKTRTHAACAHCRACVAPQHTQQLNGMTERCGRVSSLSVRIRDITGSNLDQEIHYPGILRRFTQQIHANAEMVSRIWTRLLISTIYYYSNITLSILCILL